MQVPISVPSSTDLESILSPDPIFSDLQLKEINYNAPGNTAWPPDYICINLFRVSIHLRSLLDMLASLCLLVYTIIF